VDSYSKMSGIDWRNKHIFSLWQKSVRKVDEAAQYAQKAHQ